MNDQGIISVANIKDARSALNKIGVPFFLFLGTALGAYRDGTFCPGDEDDVDFGLHDKYFKRKDEIIAALKDVGLELKDAWIPSDKVAPELSFVRAGCKIDLFFITSDKKRTYWRFYQNREATQYKTKSIDRRFFDKCDTITFFDTKFSVPSPIEEYLEANYGDWKTPIHRDNWDWLNDNNCEDADE